MTQESSDCILAEAREYELATPCLICGESVPIPNFCNYPVVCDECKRAIELVKSLYKNEPCWDCKDFKCGCCTKEATQCK